MFVSEGTARPSTRPKGFVQVSQEKKEGTFQAKGMTQLRACGESMASLRCSSVWQKDGAEGGEWGHTRLER